MLAALGDLVVRIGADPGPFEKGLRKAGIDLDKFGDKGKRVAVGMVKVGAAITAATAAAAAGGYALALSASETGAEIERLSRLAGATPREFQRWAAASRTVGIEQDKLGDILKDVQDRVGDFIETGGGPMKDFFENIAPQVGVTAEAFKDLSGPQALQLYVNSLQRAGLNQNQMTFYLEAMASDLSLLLPLLKDGGAGLQEIGDRAEAAGRVLSDDAVEGSAKLRAELGELTKYLNVQMTEAILDNKEEIIQLAEYLSKTLPPILDGVVRGFSAVAGAIDSATKLYETFSGKITEQGAINLGRSVGLPPSATGGDGPIWTDPLYNNGGGSLSDDGARLLYPGLFDNPAVAGGAGGGGGGGGGLAERFQLIEEETAAHHGRLIEGLGEYWTQRLDLLGGWADQEKALETDKASSIEAVERASQQARLAAWSGALGDLASLMQSGSEKAFRIGKAAAVAQAVVDGHAAAVAAWNKGMAAGGPPLAAAFAGMSIARTGAMIASINRTSVGGVSGGGGGSGAGSALAAPVSDLRTVEIALTGDGLEGALARQFAGQLIPLLNEEIKNGGRVDFRLV